VPLEPASPNAGLSATLGARPFDTALKRVRASLSSYIGKSFVCFFQSLVCMHMFVHALFDVTLS
jgi:hypothetical protein